MKSLKTQAIRVGFVFAIIILMAIYQYDFLLSAISSNPALNFTILGTCAFGFALILRGFFRLKNEFNAFSALVELYENTTRLRNERKPDLLWQFRNSQSLAIVFKKPVVLGQAYQLLTEQLYRDQDLTISASTMQTLIEGIDERLHDMKSLISYIAGILVFLGLIGTFIGLMVTLASVGDILGGLDLSGGDPTETVSTLMKNLQTPLGGMATGFSSSLFGLLTSLSISLMLQFLGKSGGTLKSDFSDWLSNVVEIHEGAEKGGNDAGGGSSHIEERRLALLMRTAQHSIRTTSRHSREIEKLNASIDRLATETSISRQTSADILSSLKLLSEQSVGTHQAVARSIDAFHHVAQTVDFRSEIGELTSLLTAKYEAKDAHISQSLADIYQKLGQIAQTEPDKTALDEEADTLARELTDYANEMNITEINRLLSDLYAIQTAKYETQGEKEVTKNMSAGA